MPQNSTKIFYGPEGRQWALVAPGGCPEGGQPTTIYKVMTIYIGHDQLEIRQRTSAICFMTISCKEITTFLTKMVVIV